MAKKPKSIRITVSAAIIRDNTLLLVEYRDHDSVLFNLPGGGVEFGEAMKDALRREMKEETTAQLKIGRHLLTWEYVPQGPQSQYGPIQQLGLVFEATLVEGSNPHLPKIPEPNQVDVRWIPFQDIPQLNLIPPIWEPLWAALQNTSSHDRFYEIREPPTLS